MAIVLTIDQRSSRSATTRIDEWVDELNDAYSASLEQPFVAAVGDEMQALVRDPNVVLDCVVRGVRDREWWVGIGLGEVEHPLGSTAARSEGLAFYNAREAVERAKGQSYGFALVAPDPEEQADLEAVLETLGFIISRRGRANSKRWQAVELASKGLRVGEIGAELGISWQSASERLKTAGWREEQAQRRLFGRLLNCWGMPE